MPGASDPTSVSTKQQRIAELARQMPDKAMTSLSHHIDLDWMLEAYRRTRKDGATGIDGQTAEDYQVNLEGNLKDLLDRAKSGDRYKAPPVRRVYIPKSDGSSRPLGIPTFEDKILQRAAVMALVPLYEQDFLDCSYGFRPKRSAHQALEVIWNNLMDMGGGWVLDVDIRQFFNCLNHTYLREILAKRMQDGVITRLIGKWLNAGVWENGVISHPDEGTPQGGVVSPVLSNIYLHEVLDTWFENVVKPYLKGKGFMVRFADDFVMGFARKEDAERVMAVLPKRFEKYGLTLHPEKTRMLDFRTPALRRRPEEADGPIPFDFLGFTHYWAKSRKGYWVIKRKTSGKRLTRAIHKIKDWCRANRHRPVKEQQTTMRQKMQGHYNYYGITGNSHALGQFRHQVELIWCRWLSRRSQRAYLGWAAFERLLKRFPLPLDRVVHSIHRQAANP